MSSTTATATRQPAGRAAKPGLHLSRNPRLNLCLTIAALLLSLPALALPPPTPYEASYEARAMGMKTDAYRRLEAAPDDRFALSHGLSVSVLGANLITMTEQSSFGWDEGGVVPLHYQYQQSGVRRRNEQVVFDHEHQLAQMERDGRQRELGISADTLDDLSFSAQLSAELMHQPGLRAEGQILRFEILDARRLETHEYRVLGNEQISTPAGELDALKLERIRDNDSGRSTVIWLSPAHDYLLARLMQTEENGSEMVLNLKQISWTP